MTIHLRSLAEARPVLREHRKSGRTLGGVNTLGALHEGHRRVIRLAAEENDDVVVTIYPNRAQFAPGTQYKYDLERDVAFAFASGATHVISSRDDEMYPSDHGTFLDQGDRTQRLDGTVVPFLFRGMVTMCIRWINFVRPDRTYWGLKDIGQALLVRRAVIDLLIDTQVREVPCIRFTSGIPISSRLLDLDRDSLLEVASVYRALEAARMMVAAGERSTAAVLAGARDALRLERFQLRSAKIAEAAEFTEPGVIPDGPFILQLVVNNGTINHFDGLLLRSGDDICNGPATIWLDTEWP